MWIILVLSKEEIPYSLPVIFELEENNTGVGKEAGASGNAWRGTDLSLDECEEETSVKVALCRGQKWKTTANRTNVMWAKGEDEGYKVEGGR